MNLNLPKMTLRSLERQIVNLFYNRYARKLSDVARKFQERLNANDLNIRWPIFIRDDNLSWEIAIAYR